MKQYILLFYGSLLNGVIKIISLNNLSLRLRYAPGFNKLRLFNAKVRAFKQFYRAAKRVPAYALHLQASGFDKMRFKGFVPQIGDLPVISKKNYVVPFDLNARCVEGKMPTAGVIIDESSGSSGMPTNWARGLKERKANMKLIQFGLTSLLGKQPVFVINAFALGAWATGVNITMSCLKFAKVKSTGPDATKILNTLKIFGPDHRYVITGYPPFLKHLVDAADINWKIYDITLIFGGEAMSEGMRSYFLEKGIKRMYSSFGASDLELNMASENDFTISLRKLLHTNESLRKRLLQFNGALPMLFQYNPGDFFAESNDKGELIFTICRPNYLSPKIRYNIMDKGHVMQLKYAINIIKEMGLENEIKKPQTDLPLLFHYGRADMTVTFFGANISPNDIQEVIFTIPDLADVTNAYCLIVYENEKTDKQLVISIELTEGQLPADFSSKYNEVFFNKLDDINQDFRAAHQMCIEANTPQLLFYSHKTGPFMKNDIRIKLNYLMG